MLCSVRFIGTPQGVDITYIQNNRDASLYGEITVLIDPCILYKDNRGNAKEMFAKLIIGINNIEYLNDKPAQVKINPEKVAIFHGFDVYWLEDKKMS